jgi:redox-sensitive bicupin YhaK (pirin superfamily)
MPALLDGAESAALELRPGRKAYVHLVRGQLQVNGQSLSAGDAALLWRAPH